MVVDLWVIVISEIRESTIFIIEKKLVLNYILNDKSDFKDI